MTQAVVKLMEVTVEGVNESSQRNNIRGATLNECASVRTLS